jgi:hypothetical protein
MSALATQIEMHLLAAGGWVSTRDICARFGIAERRLRQDAARPGLLDAFAVSSTREGQSGYIHHRHLDTPDWLPIKHRLRRHAISELRRARSWDRARRNIHTGQHPRIERHTGQAILAL